MSYFEEAAPEAIARWSTEPAEGLRVAQVGALWAVGSHLTISTDPVQVVLPTGVGKTAVMTLLPFSVPTRRCLVVTPSKLVRKQVAAEFRTLKVLKRAGVVPSSFKGPQVKTVSHQIATVDAWNELEGFDVVVGTPNSLSPAYERVPEPPAGLFDLVIVDEAHHASARTWATLLAHFEDHRRVLFTATPFRRDKKVMPGEIVYNYPLHLAIKEGVYQTIEFRAVEPDGRDRDEALAIAAKERLCSSEHVEGRSALLVRTDRIVEAERLQAVYSEVGVNLGIVHSNRHMNSIKKTLEALDAGEIDGVTSVGVLGEGFDFPRFKIAVYHERHKSLPATLQFLGRLARVGEEPLAPAELLAVREDVQDETKELYEQDAAWSELIPALADAAIAQEQERREYVADFPLPRLEELSLHAIHPMKDACVYEVPDEMEIDLNIDISTVSGGSILYQGIDEANELLLIIEDHLDRPRWMNSDALDTRHYTLHAVVNDSNAGLLYVSSPTAASCRALLIAVGAEEAHRAPPQLMNRVLWGVNVQAYSSVGMRSARRPGRRQASYRMAAGTSVNRAIGRSESRHYGVGHLIGRYIDDAGHPRAIGISVGKAKVWVPENVSLVEFRDWCNTVSGLITLGGHDDEHAPLIDLRIPQQLEDFPEFPVSAALHHALLDSGLTLIFQDGFEIEIEVLQVTLERVGPSLCRLILTFEDRTVSLNLQPNGVLTGGEGVEVRQGNDRKPLTEIFEEVPPHLYFADGSVVYGSLVYKAPSELPPVPPEVLSAWNWDGTSIEDEVTSADGKPVQETVRDWAAQQPDALVIQDHGTWELADYIVVRDRPADILVELIHCKASSEPTPGHRMVADMYEVACQAMQSSRWAFSSLIWRELKRRLLEREATKSITHDDDGTSEVIETHQASGKPITFKITMVQPGLRIEGVTAVDRCNALLLNCYEWLRDQDVDLEVIGS